MEAQSYPEDIDFGKYWLILKRHWVPAGSVFIFVLLLTAIVVALQKPGYEASGKILFRKRDTTAALLTEGAGKVGELESLSQQNTPVDTEAEVLRSIPLIEKTITALNLRDKEGNPVEAEKALKNLTAKGIKGTDVLLVSYKSADPKEAAAFVNQLIKAYLDSNILVNRTETTAAREFIAQQLPKTEAELRQAEIRLRNFKEQNNVVGLKAESDSVVTSIAAFNNQIAMAQARLASTSAQIAAISKRLGFNSENAVVLSSLRQSSGVQKAFIDLQQLESQLAIQRSRYQESNPVIVNLQAKQASLKALLQERIKQVVGDQNSVPQVNLQSNESTTPALLDTLIASFVNNEVARLGLINELNSLSSSQKAYQQRANMLPQVEQELQGLERRVETVKSNYELLVRRFQEVQISENQNLGNARVVANATIPVKPTGSKKKLILGMGVVAGSLLYILAAFVLDLKDPSLKTVKEIRIFFKYTWLGVVPHLRNSKGFATKNYISIAPDLPVRDDPYGIVSEAFRMLQTNIKFLNPDQRLKMIVVTSSISKEGKSAVSANLALSFSQLGLKVLLVDADLHHPIQHHIWNLANKIGLSDLLMNEVKYEDTIYKVEKDFHVLLSGSASTNPLALIDSDRMLLLSQELSKKYDLVVFDTPPLVLVPDGLVLSKVVDSVLLVARPGVIDTASAVVTNQLLTQISQKVLGLVINGVATEHESGSYIRHIEAYHENV
jgi:capsular exopolysaccharide synthesis family protein